MERRFGDPVRLRRLAFGLFTLLVVLGAWVQDDAYVTFRTVDNVVHGRGLTWNPDERVAVYTHPLWMLIHAALYAVTGEVYFTTLAVSMACALAAFYLVVFRLARSPAMGLAAGLALAMCKSSVEYSTSGLENPLTHLLLALFAVVWLSPSPRAGRLALIAGLGCLNRPDAILLFAPALAAHVLAWSDGTSRWRRAGWTLAGFLPVVAWELFSLAYYGFLIPNSAVAKLSFGVSRWARLVQGGYYLTYTWLNDPMTWLTVGAAVAVVRWRRREDADRDTDPGADLGRETWLLAGAGVYLAYVVWIGGDYMGGRFLSAPLLCAAIVVARAPLPRLSRPRVAVALAAICLALGVGATAPLLGLRDAIPGVGDERLRFYHATGLVAGMLSDRPWPDHFFRHKGEYVRRRAENGGPRLVVDGYVGMVGFYAGPDVHVVDLLGLTDPLLARLPGQVPDRANRPGEQAWLPGHVRRPLPWGYLETLEARLEGTGDASRLADPDLAELEDRLALVARGPIWDRSRWRAIADLNLGGVRRRVEAWAARHPEMLRVPEGPVDELFSVDVQEVIDAAEKGR